MLYPSAKVIIRDTCKPGQVLLIKRNNHYEPAGGKLEVDFKSHTSESLEACAIREAQEELGIGIVIDEYVGNYYFFWSIDPHKFSSCVVFTAHIVREQRGYEGNADTCEYAMHPEWVSYLDIVEGRLPIDKRFVGLKDLLQKCCSRLA